MTPCACGCDGLAVERHHVVTRQELSRTSFNEYGRRPLAHFKVLIKDERNLLPVARRCHARHHAASRRFRLAVLPDGVFEFAAEVLGSERAYNYLRRYYVGDDPRLDALLMASCEACDATWEPAPVGDPGCPSCQTANVVRVAGEL